MADPVPLRVVVVDDETPGRRRIEEACAAAPDTTVVASCASGPEAVAAILEHEPDVVFLDVQMPGEDGFDVIARVGRQRMPGVIFVTAHDEYALRAFDVHAVDYLLKPFDDERFAEALGRAREAARGRSLERIERRLDELGDDEAAKEGRKGSATGSLRRIALPHREGARLVKVEQIDWIEADDVYVRIHVGDEEYLLRQSMRRLEEVLEPDRFVRIHRSTIVNLDRVERLHEYFRGEQVAILQDGTRLKVARSRRKELQERLSP